MQLNLVSLARETDFKLELPTFIRIDSHGPRSVEKKRKRGKRGGVRLRLRKQRLTRVPLPSVIMGNVWSLRNKVDELQGNVHYQKDFRNCCIMAFTETWLTECDRDTDMSIDGFGVPFRLDRQTGT
ncbi:hypothetical protein QTP86_013926 [Hemibagrus guttatus]|nr:hypothetical protein QTP86_013926 [Hemibagrus guttatus]